MVNVTYYLKLHNRITNRFGRIGGYSTIIFTISDNELMLSVKNKEIKRKQIEKEVRDKIQKEKEQERERKTMLDF